MNTKIILLLVILSVVFVSGCVTECGNGIVEAGEECDVDGCSDDKVCTEECKCETFSPPALPE